VERFCQKHRLKKLLHDFGMRFCQKHRLKNNLTFPKPPFMPKSTPKKRIWKVSMPKTLSEKHP
jgi:hypothetical protein